MQALDDIRILDLTQHIAGPYATKLFADYGADVIKVEGPAGDVARNLPPFQGDEPNPEKSGLFFYLNTNKRSAVIDLRREAGREALAALALRADVAVESFAPGTLDRLGCGWEFFQQVKPSLPLVSISNFGQTGPYRDFKGSDLVLYAFGGEMYSMGETNREPMKMAGAAALFESGASAAVAIFGAVYAARRFSVGQHVDVSIAETHLGGVDRRHATAIGYQFSGRKTLRASGRGAGMPGGVYPCADGFVDFTNAGLHPDRIVDMLGNPEWLADPRFSDRVARMNPAVIEEFNAHFLGWCIERTKREIWREARRAKVMCGPMFTMEDLFEDEFFRRRGFWAEAEHRALGRVTFPGRPFLLERGGWELRRPAPHIGEHTLDVLREAGVSPRVIAEVRGEDE
jgi:crotonobetainyl-CoA:carnitine CoA-transferase CaiB-like acyl-CoA transferase